MKSFNEVTPAEWRAMSRMQRAEYYDYWIKRGETSFGCLKCGYPSGDCASTCAACENHPEIRYDSRQASPEFRKAVQRWLTPVKSRDKT